MQWFLPAWLGQARGAQLLCALGHVGLQHAHVESASACPPRRSLLGDSIGDTFCFSSSFLQTLCLSLGLNQAVWDKFINLLLMVSWSLQLRLSITHESFWLLKITLLQDALHLSDSQIDNILTCYMWLIDMLRKCEEERNEDILPQLGLEALSVPKVTFHHVSLLMTACVIVLQLRRSEEVISAWRIVNSYECSMKQDPFSSVMAGTFLLSVWTMQMSLTQQRQTYLPVLWFDTSIWHRIKCTNVPLRQLCIILTEPSRQLSWDSFWWLPG